MQLIRSIALALGLVLCGCAELTGEYDGAGGHVSIVVDRGYARDEDLMADVETVIDTIAVEGPTVSAYLLEGGSAARMREIDLSSAYGGDLWPDGRNPVRHGESIAERSEAIVAAIRDELAHSALHVDEADLLGAVAFAAEELAAIDDGPARLVVLTGGGVHRTADADLVTAFREGVTGDEFAQTIAARMHLPAVVPIRVIGVGRFTGLADDPDPAFVETVRSFWASLCSDNDAIDCTASPTLTPSLLED